MCSSGSQGRGKSHACTFSASEPEEPKTIPGEPTPDSVRVSSRATQDHECSSGARSAGKSHACTGGGGDRARTSDDGGDNRAGGWGGVGGMQTASRGWNPGSVRTASVSVGRSSGARKPGKSHACVLWAAEGRSTGPGFCGWQERGKRLSTTMQRSSGARRPGKSHACAAELKTAGWKEETGRDEDGMEGGVTSE